MQSGLKASRQNLNKIKAKRNAAVLAGWLKKKGNGNKEIFKFRFAISIFFNSRGYDVPFLFQVMI